MPDSVARDACLDGVTEEDVEAGNLNDDQIQAMWGISLEEAQSALYKRIAAVCTGCPETKSASEMAELFYGRVCQAGGKRIDDVDESGLLDP